ncbi:MAG: thioesterase, partial [Bacteroides sp.]
IDINGHVNSIRYIEHILDLFPLDLYRNRHIRRFEMAYVAESYYGDTLSFFNEEADNSEFHVEVKKNDTEVVCRAKIKFE